MSGKDMTRNLFPSPRKNQVSKSVGEGHPTSITRSIFDKREGLDSWFEDHIPQQCLMVSGTISVDVEKFFVGCLCFLFTNLSFDKKN